MGYIAYLKNCAIITIYPTKENNVMNDSVCFIGHRKINNTPILRERLQKVLQELIKSGTVNFIFGDHSEFDSLCYEFVTRLKEKYPEIRRIKFRKDYENTDDYTMQFLITGYEESVCPKGVGSGGKSSYVQRNFAMIRESNICVFYYDENYKPERRKHSACDLYEYQPKSGTAIAYAYAISKKKKICNLFEK